MKIESITNQGYYSQNTQNKQKQNISRTVFLGKPKLRLIDVNDFSALTDNEKIRDLVHFAKTEAKKSFRIKATNDIQKYFDIAKTYIGIKTDKEKYSELQSKYDIIGESTFIQQNSLFFARLLGHDNNNIEGFREFSQSILNTNYVDISRSEISRNIGVDREHLIFEYGIHNGALNFLQKNIKFFEGLISNNKEEKPIIKIETKQKPTSNLSKGQELVLKYREMAKEASAMPYTTPEEKQLRNAKKEELRKIYHEIKEKNISMVIKEEYSLDPAVDAEAKKNYLRRIYDYAVINEASQKDCLLEYERYGYRYWTEEGVRSSFISDLCVIASHDFSDKKFVVNKFLDIAERVAEYDPTGMKDGVKICVAYERFMQNYKLNEEETLRFIELAKRISYQRKDALIYSEWSSGPYSPCKDSEKVKNAIKELEEKLKDCPWEFVEKKNI